MRLRQLFGVLALLTAFSAGIQEASAATIVFDNITEAGGSIEYDGTNVFTTEDISFDLVVVSGAPVNDGSYYCSNCMLSFVSGDKTGQLTSIAEFGSGGSFLLTGSVYTDDTLTNLIATGTLLTGSFTVASWQIGENGKVTFSGSGADEKNVDLAEYFGLDPAAWVFASTNITAQNCSTNINNFVECDIDEADITNDTLQSPGDPVPEPGSMLLLGTGLMGLAASARRRMRRKNK